MAELSKFYKVTNLIMLEYIADLYITVGDVNAPEVNYSVYTGKDNNVYYVETSGDSVKEEGNGPNSNNKWICVNPSLFVKFPDESDSEYTYLGLIKNDKDEYTNKDIIKDNIKNNVKAATVHSGKMHHDKIRLHFIYGFMFDKLAGITLLVKTNALCLVPIQKNYTYSVNHKVFDDAGNPVFETDTIEGKTYERLGYEEKELTLLDIFFPKECIVLLDGMVNWHVTPIYLNGSFYDRYIEFSVPSSYFLSLDAGNDTILSVLNPYGYDPNKLYSIGSDKNVVYYAEPASTVNDRYITYNVNVDPTVIINFATVSEENLTPIDPLVYSSTFFLDPINLIAIKYKSNSDFFNVRLLEDTENNEIIYYPVFGDGANATELNYHIFLLIETGAIPLMTEGFYDAADNMDTFYEMYGDNAYKWIIYNDITVTYLYSKIVGRETDTTNISSKYVLHFTNIIDYGIQNPEEAGEFWKNSFIPKVLKRNNLSCKSILISYTCRLVNRLTSVEAIRRATLTIENPEKYVVKRVSINNVITYKVVNQIKTELLNEPLVKIETKDKVIRSYYDATNIVIKDINSNNTYTQGLMTLYLKHTSSNYILRLYVLNDDNVRVPYDLTGPYRYLLVFPTTDGNKIKIKPNADSTAVNLGIGLLAFYITEEQVKRIMNVPVTERYFAIVTDTEYNDSMQSTLYEGKVSYY